MKKLVKPVAVMALVLVLAMGLSACGDRGGGAESSSLYAQGLEVVQLMSEMARSEEYWDAYGAGSEAKAVIQDISVGDYTAPKCVYAITVSNEDLAAMAELDRLGDMSEGLRSFLARRAVNSLMTQINGMGGVQSLAASSMCAAGKVFVNEDAREDVIYLYTYENAVPAAVAFTVGEGHAVSASGVFVIYDKFTCGSADEIQSFFGDIPVKVREVFPEG